MRASITRFGQWLRGLSSVSFVLAASLIMLFVNLTSSLTLDLMGIEIDPESLLDVRKNTLKIIAMALFVAPIVETFLFQKIIFYILRKIKWLDRHKIYIMVVSGLIFGSMHDYSLAYIIVGTMLGILLMFFYITRCRKDAYWSVVAVHFIVNAVSLLLNYYVES